MEDIMVGELNAVVQGLGGKAGIGRIVRTDSDLRAAIREGLPHAAVEELMQAANLSLRNSPRVSTSRFAACRGGSETGGWHAMNPTVSIAWRGSSRLPNTFRGPQAGDGLAETAQSGAWRVPPLEAIDTELGARTVENVLGRIGYGGVS